MKQMTIAVAAVMLTACAVPVEDGGYWQHRSDQDRVRYQRDWDDCRRGDSERSCMERRGYSWRTDGVRGPVNNQRMAEFAARQVGCTTPPLSRTVQSQDVEVFRFRCVGGREVTFTCKQGSCSGE